MASTQHIQGIDVSHHQGEVDWNFVHGDGFKFAYVKATEGTGYVDPRFTRNWANLRAMEDRLQGGTEVFFRGAYHFARPDTIGGEKDGIEEAKSFCDALKKAGGYGCYALPPMLDFEKYSDSDEKQNIPWISGWVKTVQDMLGRTPGIYTGANIWNYEVGNTGVFSDLPLWLVRYSQAASVTTTAIGLPWEEWTFWQWSGGGEYGYGPLVATGVNGKKSRVDLNRFSGSLADLRALALMKEEEPAGPPTTTPPLHGGLDLLGAMLEQHEATLKALRVTFDALKAGT